jgi:hypothetical protein
LETLKTNLAPEEQQILAVKYKSAQFGKMEWGDLDLWANALLIKINAITGWVVPDDTLDILVDQFRKKLSESYKNCNPDEVEYAFRNYGTAVKDWGKQMNLSLIDEVMIPYLNRRYELSQLEEQKAKPILEIENKEDMSKEAMQDWFEVTAKAVKCGEIKLEFVPLMLYEFMDDNGNISATKEEKYEYLQKAVEYRLGKLREEVELADTPNNRWRLSNFVRMRESGEFNGDEVDKLKALAKKMILFDMILNAQK